MQPNEPSTEASSRLPIRLGMVTAVAMVAITTITFSLAMVAVPISGANAPGGGLAYPYLDTLKQYPKDYLWQFLSIGLIICYLVLWVSIHSIVEQARIIFSRISLVFAIISSTILLSNYFVHFTVVPVSLLKHETEGIPLITQYNPHGVFIALEEIGYFMMSLSFVFIAPAFGRKVRLESTIKWIFIVAFAMICIAFIAITIRFGIDRQDRFETIIISINWIVLIVNSIILSIVFGIRLKKMDGDSAIS